MLEVGQIYKSYDGNRVLKGASFKVQTGSIYGLIGRNGAGKTTLMNIIVGLLPKESGQILLDGEELTKESYQSIGYLPDLPAFFEYMTAAEYLDFLLKNENSKRRDELLELVSIGSKTVISKMSRGMRQRLGIAAALVNDPQLILLDEPTSALDPQGRADVMDILLDLKRSGRTVILSTHILADMERVCDDYGFLHNGVIINKTELDIKDKVAILVSFKDNIELPAEVIPGVEMTRVSPNTYRFEALSHNPKEAQGKILSYISTIEMPIRSITNEVLTLDSLFREVCSE